MASQQPKAFGTQANLLRQQESSNMNVEEYEQRQFQFICNLNTQQKVLVILCLISSTF